MSEKLTSEEFYSWKANEVTKKVLRQIQVQADEYLQRLADGTALQQDSGKPGGVPWTVGVLHGIGRIFEIETEVMDGPADSSG